ncbi:MAG: 5'/3'-nucleotidase SurE [Planctomycetota bacterium]
MRILLTNDDGVQARGLHALHDAIADLGEVHVVAPFRVQSATSHAITLHRSIRVEPYACDRFEGMAVHGRPADCVKLAVAKLVPSPIDLVISGINHGANVGVNVHYSGTVGAAREGAFLGIPAIAVSLHLGDFDHEHWPRAAAHARSAIDRILQVGIDPGTLFNVNVPILDGGAEPLGTIGVPLNPGYMLDRYEQTTDEDGMICYRAKDSMAFSNPGQGTDVDKLYERYVTITPLHYEQTDADELQRLQDHLSQ